VAHESAAAKEHAPKRLLSAAKEYRIVPVGFIIGQLPAETDRLCGQITVTDAASLLTGTRHLAGERYRLTLRDQR
jgi:hypothetical protein